MPEHSLSLGHDSDGPIPQIAPGLCSESGRVVIPAVRLVTNSRAPGSPSIRIGQIHESCPSGQATGPYQERAKPYAGAGYVFVDGRAMPEFAHLLFKTLTGNIGLRDDPG